MYAIAPGEVGLSLAARKSLQSFLPLKGGQLGRAAKLHTASPCSISSFASPCPDELALKFRETAQHSKHEAAMGRRCICPCIE